MDIGIIGSANIGSILARNLKALRHQVAIANSRGPATLVEFAAETGVAAAAVEQAAQAHAQAARRDERMNVNPATLDTKSIEAYTTQAHAQTGGAVDLSRMIVGPPTKFPPPREERCVRLLSCLHCEPIPAPS